MEAGQVCSSMYLLYFFANGVIFLLTIISCKIYVKFHHKYWIIWYHHNLYDPIFTRVIVVVGMIN